MIAKVPTYPHAIWTLYQLEIWLKNVADKYGTWLHVARQAPDFYISKVIRQYTSCQGRVARLQILPLHAALGSILTHVWVLLAGPSGGTRGVVLGHFDTWYIPLRIGTIDNQFHTQSIPQNFTTKHYDILVQLRLVFECLGHLTSKRSQTLRNDC